jgi:hypothetical protein
MYLCFLEINRVVTEEDNDLIHNYRTAEITINNRATTGEKNNRPAQESECCLL